MSAPDPNQTSLTGLLDAWRRGDGHAYARIFDEAYEELKRMAASRLRGTGGQLTLNPTELLHEAVVRLGDAPPDWQNRAHFFASMSLYIRAAMVDHARARLADKRGGDQVRVTFNTSNASEEAMTTELIALDEALTKLAALDPRSADVLHLTYFAGLDRERIAEVLSISVPTVDRELRFARSWLNANMGYGL